MKKIIASVGLAALGAFAVQTSQAQTVTSPDNSKPWSLSATVRGFYDDNTAGLPDDFTPLDGHHKRSAGFEVSPAGALRWAMDQTTASLGLLYTLKYYADTPPGSTKHYDQVFTADAAIDHAISEVQRIAVRDSFVVGQEPDLLRTGDSTTTFQRIPGSNFRNYGVITYNAQLAPRFSTELGYDNAWFAYADDSLYGTAALLNRIENRAHVEGVWEVQPETHAVLGYQFKDTSYTKDAPVAPGVDSSERDSRSHYVYVGLEHHFQQELTGTVRVGGIYTEYYNNPYGNGDHLSPYARASLRWNYLADSFVEGGFSYDRNASDIVGATPTGITLDAQSTVVYATINHKITPRLTGAIIAQYQDSTYEGGSANNQSEHFFTAGLNFAYQFTPNLSASAGYNYDKLDSDLNRGFDRNRVYVGITATY